MSFLLTTPISPNIVRLSNYEQLVGHANYSVCGGV